MRRIGIGLVLLFAGLGACASGGGGQDVAATLAGTQWTLVEVDGEGLPARDGGPAAELVFLEEERFAGSVGCNRVLGGAKQDGAALALTPGPMTMMACPPPLDVVEQKFVAVLGQVTGHRQEDGALLLLSGERVVLRLTAK